MTLDLKFQGDNGYEFESTVAFTAEDLTNLSTEAFTQRYIVPAIAQAQNHVPLFEVSSENF